eukprot:TRINITY_DN4617_c0_g4_i1.p1 TRINITY_DN4617_c0_g4~~TRINITY_DN4617_c0_g4_i1.p1  ORF type:complete len:574 (-),score=90.46 TRINITY_DN4617_c0_g4_i1:245-1966(-)
MSQHASGGKDGGELTGSGAVSSPSTSKRRDRSRSESVPSMSAWPLAGYSVESPPSGGGNGIAGMGAAASGSGSEGAGGALAVTGLATTSPVSLPNLALPPLPPIMSPSPSLHGTMSFPASKMMSSAGDLAASPYGTMPPMYMVNAPPPQSNSRRSGSMGIAPSAGRSSSAGAHWGSGGFPHHQFQPPQPYPDHRSSSAALPHRPRLSDISESEDDTGDDDSPRTTTPPRSRQRNKRASTARSGSADNQSGSQSERGGQPQYFSRWKLNKSVIPPEIQAYTDQVRRQHLIIDDSRDGTGSSSSNGQSPRHSSSSKHAASVKTETSANVPPLSGLPQMAYPAAFAGMAPYNAAPHPQGGRTSSLPAQVYLQYAGYSPVQNVNPSQVALSSTPSSPRASSAVVAPSWGMAPNPFFPNQGPPLGVPGVPMGSEMFYANPQFRGGPFPPQFMPSSVPVAYPGANIPYGAPMFQGAMAGGPTNSSVTRSTDSLPSSQPMSPRSNSSFPSPYGASSSSGAPSSSLEELMKEKLFALADVAAVAAHKTAKPSISEQMDISSDEEDMSEASDDRSGGTRMQL